MAKPDWTKFRGYWNLDEAGNTNATDSSPYVNTLTQTGGDIESLEGGRDFELADTEYFTRADNASLSFGDVDFTIGCSVKLESQATTQFMINKYNYGGNWREYYLGYDTLTDRYKFWVSSDGTFANGTALLANNYGAVPATTKAFVMAWSSSTDNKLYMSVDNGAANEVAHAGGCNDNISAFALGAIFNGAAVENWLDGIMWSAFVYADLMTAAERTWMYNAGVPRKWSEIYFVPKTVFLCDFGKTCKKVNGLWRPRNLGLSGA